VSVQEDTLVLVVEPDDVTLADMVKAMRRGGFAAVGVRTFDHAREQIAIDPPTVLITEARLGSYSGFHLAHVARQRRSECQVVVLADLPDAALERDALQAGAAILARPLPADTLLRVLSMLLGRATPTIGVAAGTPVERRQVERRQLIIPGYTPERRVADRRRTAWIPPT
jgi:ActR/RegA family two-component response regulator